MEIKIGFALSTMTAYLVASPEALPAEATIDLGTFTHAASGDSLPGQDHAVSHALYHHVQEILGKRSAADPSQAATFPNGIHDMQRVTIELSGDIIKAKHVDANEVTVAPAATEAVVMYYEPEDALADNSHFTYVSADTSVATVDAAGVVTGVAAGSTTITATQANSGLSVEIPVKVA